MAALIGAGVMLLILVVVDALREWVMRDPWKLPE
jgi:hypothetical protein